MHRYRKQFEDAFGHHRVEHIAAIGSRLGSREELQNRFTAFYKIANDQLFYMAVMEAWLDAQFKWNGQTRRRMSNGHYNDRMFSYFLKGMVGFNQKMITASKQFSAIVTYFKDFFPDFANKDPFEEPEYFKFPYKNINIGHLCFVYQMDERMELLAEAEAKGMKLLDFMNWVVNYALCYNVDIDKEVYGVSRQRFDWPFIKKLRK